jgi:hypothetical protein
MLYGIYLSTPLSAPPRQSSPLTRWVWLGKKPVRSPSPTASASQNTPFPYYADKPSHLSIVLTLTTRPGGSASRFLFRVPTARRESENRRGGRWNHEMPTAAAGGSSRPCSFSGGPRATWRSKRAYRRSTTCSWPPACGFRPSATLRLRQIPLSWLSPCASRSCCSRAMHWWRSPRPRPPC